MTIHFYYVEYIMTIHFYYVALDIIYELNLSVVLDIVYK
jgi:hypothetical protein